MAKSLKDTLNGTPSFVITLSHFFGVLTYEYKFRLTESSSEPHVLNGTVEMRRVPSRQFVKNEFKLFRYSDKAYVLASHKLYNKPSVPLITVPVEYRPRPNAWVFTGDFDDMRALFTLNTVED